MKILGQGCRVTPAQEGEQFREGARAYRMPICRAQGAKEIAQTINRYDRGRAPARRNQRSEEVMFVVAGEGICFIDGYAYALRPETAIYAPAGSGYQFENSVEEPLEVISVCCPEETSVEIHPHPLEPASGDAPKRTIHLSESKAIPTGDRRFHLLIGREFDCQRVTQFLGVIPPGRAPMHYHTYEEAIFILQGRGVVWADEESGEFEAGASIYLPIGQRHSLENTGTEEIRLLGVFYPSGSPAVNYKN